MAATKTGRNGRTIGLAFGVALACAGAGWVAGNTPAAAESAGAGAAASFPAAAARYQARLSDLVDPDARQFDAAFARRFDALIAPYAKTHPRFKDRITSGPATRAAWLGADSAGGAGRIHYAICQAHQCDATTLDVLYDPASGAMGAKLMDRCQAHWLGAPDASDKAMLDAAFAASHAAAAAACGGGR